MIDNTFRNDLKAYQIKSDEANDFLSNIQRLYGVQIDAVCRRYAAAKSSTYTHHYCGPSTKADWHWDITSNSLDFGWTEDWGDSIDSDSFSIPLTFLFDDSLLPAFEAECAAKVEQNKKEAEEKERQDKLYQLVKLQKELGL